MKRRHVTILTRLYLRRSLTAKTVNKYEHFKRSFLVVIWRTNFETVLGNRKAKNWHFRFSSNTESESNIKTGSLGTHMWR